MPFTRHNGKWGEFMKNYDVIKRQANLEMRSAAEEDWNGNNKSGIYSLGRAQIELNRSFSLPATLNGVSYVVKGGFEIDRVNREVMLKHNIHGILDKFDSHEADNPQSSWADWTGRQLRRNRVIYPSWLAPYQDFFVTITWDSDDVTLFMDNGTAVSGAGGANVWPFSK